MKPLSAILLQFHGPGIYTAEDLVTGVLARGFGADGAASDLVAAVDRLSSSTPEEATHFSVWKGPERADVLKRAREVLDTISEEERAAVMGLLLSSGETLQRENSRLQGEVRMLRVEAGYWQAIDKLSEDEPALGLVDAVERARCWDEDSDQ